MEYSIYTEQKYLPNGTIEARILTAAEAERHGYGRTKNRKYLVSAGDCM